VSIVLDASVSLAWVFQDEATEAIDHIFEAAAISGALVPGNWRLEVANGLRMAVRRRRIDMIYVVKALDRLATLPIEIDPETNLHAWKSTLELADRYDLTPYDAAYIELAQRSRLPLATLDRKLARAAADAGVTSSLNQTS
jgi:predicted nucleic acid-binding protein